jgi:serine protease Do
MIRQVPVLAAALGMASCGGWALDTLVLKEQAAVSGRILAEKADQFVVDVGYTVLLIPRQEVVEVRRDTPPASTSGDAPAAPPAPAEADAAPPASAGSGAAPASRLFRTSAGPVRERAVRELVAEVGEAVVQVRTSSGLGSGFFINPEGYLITNFHVIEGETQISVEVYHQKAGQLERRTYKQVRIIAMNKFRDLALLRVEDPGAPPFVAVPLGDSDALAVGERVFAVGSPLGLERTVTEGIISTKTREMQGDLYLQTTAQINPGNSGGPLFNLRGEVVGVTNMKISFGEGLGFAIPVRAVRDFLVNRDAFAYDNNNPSSGYRYLEPPRKMRRPAGETAPPSQ